MDKYDLENNELNIESTETLEENYGQLSEEERLELLIEDEDFNIARRKALRKAIFSSVLYLFLFIITGSIFVNLGLQMGLFMILVVVTSMIPIYLYIGKDKTKELLKSRKYKFGFTDFVFFLGLMFLLTLIFNSFAQSMMKIFNITSVDVTSQLQQTMNPILMLYVVLIGPFAEELQYRGYYLNHVRKYGLYISIILSGITFSLAHMNFIQGIGTLGIGIVLGYVAYNYSFSSAVLLHITNNLIVSLIGLFMDPNSPESVSLQLIIIMIVMWGSVLFAIATIFSSKRRNRMKESLKLTKFEKSGIKALLTDPVFITYLVFSVALAIYAGRLS